jgi:cell division septum initiation protein DivIVA
MALHTPLLADTPPAETAQLDASDLLSRPLPVTFRGYDRKTVDELRAGIAQRMARLERALEDRRTNEAELAAEIERLGGEVRSARSAAAVRQPTGEHTVSVLAQAQSTADMMLRDAQAQAARITAAAQDQASALQRSAQHDAEQMTFHAQAQAGQMVREAQERARVERLRIIETATEEARAEVDRFHTLARDMQKGMQATLADHLDKQTTWDTEINKPVPPEPARPGDGVQKA